MAKKTMKAVESGNKKAGIMGAAGLVGAKATLKNADVNRDGGRTMTAAPSTKTTKTMTAAKSTTERTPSRAVEPSTKTATMGAQKTMTAAKSTTERTPSRAVEPSTKTATMGVQKTMTVAKNSPYQQDQARTITQRSTSAATAILGVQAGMNVAKTTTPRTMTAVPVNHGTKLEKNEARTITRRTTSKEMGSVATAGIIGSMGLSTIARDITLSDTKPSMEKAEYGDSIQAFGMPGMSILGQLMGMNSLFGMSQGIESNRLYGMEQIPFTVPITGFTNPQADEKGEPVTYNNLCVLNFPAMRIETFEITNKVNEHARLHFTGFIEDDGSYILTNTMVCSPIKVVYFTDKGAQVPFFAGVITNVRIYTQDGNQAIEITALSNTSTLDTMKVSRSCQNINTTYAGLMDSVAYQSGASMLYGLEEGAFASTLGTISIQYKETNWEYLKRLASHKYQGLFPDMTVEAPVFSVGALGKEHTDVELQTCEYLKDIRSYETDHANYIQGIMEEDYVLLKVETYRILKLGDAIKLENKKYYIREATYEMRNGIVVASYLLCTENGLRQRRIKNEKVQGLSINGITMGVERDKVKIQLDIDSAYNAEYLFPYSTMSASPDGSGWYCMPQQGDLLRVYFPDEEEENCFAISSVSSYTPEEGAANDRMGDPNVRYLRTPDNKEVCLTPDGITISADDGQAIIRMDNAGNIIISGANSINMSATNDINISATRNVSVYAADTLKVSGQSGTITMDSSGNTRLTGQYVLEN